MDLQKVKEALIYSRDFLKSQMYSTNYLDAAIAELEKPAEDAEELLGEIRSWCDGWCVDDNEARLMIQQYAEAYHARMLQSVGNDK